MSDLEQLKAAIDSKMATNLEVRYILKLISNGKASLDESAKYSQILSHILGQELASEVLELSDREDTTSQLLRGAYDDVNDIYSQVQNILDQKVGIAINPKRAPFPAERVKQFAHSLVDPTVEDSVIKRRARAGSETITKSFHDDCIETNAKFRDNAGLKSYIIRKGSDCCEWCTKVAGKYRIGDQPDGIFRRHDNCDCTIIYDGQVLRGQSGAEGKRGKKWVEVSEGAGAEDAVRYSQDQARKLNDEKANNKNVFAEYSKVKSEKPMTIVNPAIINSPEYRSKFNIFDEEKQVQRTMFSESRKMLLHRTGTEYEDLSFVDSKTGKYITRTDYNVIREVIPSNRMLKMVDTSEPYSIIAIHNHPLSGVPSIKDLGAASERKYKYGLIACHNGDIYRYSIIDKLDTSDENLNYINMLLDKTQKTIYNKNDLGDKFASELNETLSQLSDKNIKLEVLLWK